MYEQFFGLRERPFDLTPNPRFLVMTDGHREALSNLEYAIDSRKGVTLLLGEAGSGKTTVIRAAVEQATSRVHCVHLHNPALTRNEFVEMLVLCWKPGQRTPIHDHNGSHGAVFVQQGILWETTFDYDVETGLNYKSHRELRAGGLTGSEVPDIHQLGNPDVSGRDLVTIHIYAPPLGVLKTYKLGSSTIDLYTPAEPDFV